MNKLKVSVLGGGSFGTALGTMAARCGHNVLMYTRTEQTLNDINLRQRNLRFFPEEIELPINLKATDNVDLCLENSDIVIHAIPVQKSYDFIMENRDKIPRNIPYIISSKGILLKQNKFFSEAWSEFFPKNDVPHCVLSGPSFAIEIMKANPTLVTLACEDKLVRSYVQEQLHNSSFRIYTTDDVIGCEIGGALKNPLAIAAGVVEGMGYGINTNSALVTRGILEMSLFSQKFGGKTNTLYGLSGIGDVMLTCLGDLSRNKAVGLKLAKGLTLDEITATSKEVAEGVPTTFVLDNIMKQHNLNMPCFRILAKIVKGSITPNEGAKYLMIKDLEEESALKI